MGLEAGWIAKAGCQKLLKGWDVSIMYRCSSPGNSLPPVDILGHRGMTLWDSRSLLCLANPCLGYTHAGHPSGDSILFAQKLRVGGEQVVCLGSDLSLISGRRSQ